MINKEQFQHLECQMPHGRIPRELLESLYDIIEDGDIELAHEIAFAAIEYSLCGDSNYTDNREVMAELRPYKRKLKNNLDNYSISCDDKIKEMRLDEIAKLYWGDKLTQAQVGAKLGLPQQTVSYRTKFIRTNYPELYQLYQ